jgi:NAD(P)-dependent dehydrogenase (short-subunit alcohol dehydrogenase family)
MADLEGKTVLITGASSGIGAATARVLALHGADVAVNYRNSREQAEEVARSIRELGRNAMLLQADVTDREQVRAIVSRMLAEWGRIDVLVANVGHAFYKRIENLEPADWYQSVDQNLTSQIYTLQAVLPHMLERRGGRIVLVSSISAQRGSPSGDLSYSACKAGIHAITKTLAAAYARQGIAINTVAPGIIDTGMTGSMPAERKVRTAGSVPLGRLGRGEEVGEVIAFFACERASYVTGQMIAVNGGLYM